MATARKTTDAVPADDVEPAATVADPEAPPVEEEAAAPVEEFRAPVTLVFHGQAESHVAGVGLCVPDGEYLVPAAVADTLCRGDAPLFTRAA